jgi:phosphohistidine phosphatase
MDSPETIYLLRHAIAVARGTADYPGDDRPLTPSGISKMKRNAAGMLALGLGFGAVLHSPLARSRDTARIVINVLGLACPVAATDALLPDADPAEILREIPGTKTGSILLVGHEPHLGSLIAALLGAADPPVILRKGGLAKISVGAIAAGSGRVEWILTPRQLRMLGERG